jgi:hypothetical protein
VSFGLQYLTPEPGDRRPKFERRLTHDKYGPVSLDAPLYDDNSIRLIDKITTGLWQSYDQTDFHQHDA